MLQIAALILFENPHPNLLGEEGTIRKPDLEGVLKSLIIKSKRAEFVVFLLM